MRLLEVLAVLLNLFLFHPLTNASTPLQIIINKILMPPDAYNEMLKQQQSPTGNQKATSSSATKTTAPAPTVANVPIQLIKNLQSNLGPLVLSSGIQVMPNQKLLVTNPGGVFTTANMIPLQQPAGQLGPKQANLRIITSTAQQPGVQQPGQLKQLQLPFIIKSIMNPLPVQTGVTLTTTQAKTATIPNLNSIQVNPISSVKPLPLNRQTAASTAKQAAARQAAAKSALGRVASSSKQTTNKTPEKPIVDNRKDGRTKKSRVSFNFEKNTSTSIKPISNDLPLTASNVLLTSTPKQSIIKKPAKVFDLPCTPIVNHTNNLTSRKPVGTRATVAIQHATIPTANGEATISPQIAENSGPTQLVARLKYCKTTPCDCDSNVPADDLESLRHGFNSLNAPKQQLYIYCLTIKLNEKAKFDFEKYAFYVRTRKGFTQVCGQAFMKVFGKNNLSFVETAHKKFNI